MAPWLSLREWDVLGLGAGIGIGAVVKAWQLGDVGVDGGSGPKNVIFSNGPKIIFEWYNLLY